MRKTKKGDDEARGREEDLYQKDTKQDEEEEEEEEEGNKNIKQSAYEGGGSESKLVSTGGCGTPRPPSNTIESTRK